MYNNVQYSYHCIYIYIYIHLYTSIYIYIELKDDNFNKIREKTTTKKVTKYYIEFVWPLSDQITPVTHFCIVTQQFRATAAGLVSDFILLSNASINKAESLFIHSVSLSLAESSISLKAQSAYHLYDLQWHSRCLHSHHRDISGIIAILQQPSLIYHSKLPWYSGLIFSF